MAATSEWTVRLPGDLWRDDPSGADNVNGLAGKALCEDLRAALAAAAPQAQIGAPVAEDYGWGFSAQLTGQPIWIAASAVSDGDDDDEEAGKTPDAYVVSIAPPKGSWLPWKKPDPAAAADFSAIVAALEAWLGARGVAYQRES